jgi:hypothetical protein
MYIQQAVPQVEHQYLLPAQLQIWIKNLLIHSVAYPGPGSGAFFASGSGIGKKSRSGIRDEHPGSYFPELRTQFFGLKKLQLFDADPDPGSEIFLTMDPGSGMEKFVSGLNIPDPLHWLFIDRTNFESSDPDLLKLYMSSLDSNFFA